ncbi:MAG: translocation/assembly module TamB domain-containing protein [Muribaculaceae bacterium]
MILGVVLLLLILPMTLYIPVVQRYVKDVACSKASDATGWDIAVDRILLKFPLDLSVDGVTVLTEQRDTMIYAGNLALDVKLLPLLRLDVKVGDALLSHAVYNMQSEDSSMVLNAKIDRVSLDAATVQLRKNHVSLQQAALHGGDIVLHYFPEKVKSTPQDTSKVAWLIDAQSITIDSVRYHMTMMPLISDMDVMVAHAELKDGMVDIGTSQVHAAYMGINGVDVKYLYPTPEVVAEYETSAAAADSAAVQEESGELWTVRADAVRLTNSHAVYAMQGAKPSPGLDVNYIEVSDVNVSIDSLYNKGVAVTVPLKKLTAKERCGIAITDASCTFSMDSTAMAVEQLKINTVASSIKGEASMDMGFVETPAYGAVLLNADAEIDMGDVERMMPLLKPIINSVPRSRPLQLKARIDGTAQTLRIRQLSAQLPRYANVNVNGVVNNAMDVNKLGGELAINGKFDNINFVKPTMFDAEMSKQVNFPAMAVDGKARLKGNAMSGELAMTLDTGEAVGKAAFNTKSEAYDVDLTLNRLPLHALLPLSTLGNITAYMHADGRGFDVMKKSTELNAALKLNSLEYNGNRYGDVDGSLALSNGAFEAKFDSKNPNFDFALQCNGELAQNHYVVALDGDLRDVDLQAMRLMDVTSHGKGRIAAFGDVDVSTMVCDVSAEINDVSWTYDTLFFSTPTVAMRFESTDSTMSGSLNNEDMNLSFDSQVGVNKFIEQLTQCQNIALEQVNKISLNIDTLQASLPPFAVEMEMGKRGLVQQYLAYNDLKLKHMSFELYNDSTIYGNGVLQGIDAMGTKIDTISAKLVQTQRYLGYKFHMGNRPGTMDNFADVTLFGGVLGSRLTTIYNAKDIKGRTGYHFGTHADVNDSVVRATVFTPKPYIGYKEWNVNEDNYVLYDYKNQHLDANLRLDGGSSGLINLFTEHVEHEGEESDKHQEDVNLQVKGVKIEEWMSMFPFAPDVSGELSTDMTISYRGNQFWGKGNAGLKNFCYEGERVGDFNLDALMTLDPVTGNTNLESYMNVNGARVAFAAGVLNDSTATSPMSLQLDIDKFPISTMTAFIPNGIAQLQGYLNGKMTMLGTFDNPILCGSVWAQEGAIYVPVFGSKILFPDTEVTVDSSIVHFNKYALRSCNDKPLVIDGLVDIRNMSNAYVDLNIKGSSVQFVDSKQVKKSQLFGRGYADVKASAKGRLNALYVDADLSLLSGSNLTYVLQDDVSEIVPATNPDMVHFVHFEDSVSEYGDSLLQAQTVGVNINATVTLQQGNTINAYLSPDGKNRVQVQATGSLNYSQGFSGDPRVTGRLTVDNGYVKYSPPLIKEVDFVINEGSNIAFTGNMLNPTLNFSAVEKYKATVSTDGGASRLVDFLITCNVGGTLSQMDVSFDLATNDDLTVQNELQSMTQQQRSAQAMNLMLYGSYGGSNTASMSNNALYSFLNSQINSWAASAIKGVDLSFGINQYDSESSQNKTVTSYSYNLSKSLFNDRFKIVVGGNYSTDASAEDNFSDNLISDISIEYLLNSSGSMYARMFRHTGYESILEGEITQTGVGFVIKRKLASLKHIFKFRRSRKAALRRALADSLNAVAPDTVNVAGNQTQNVSDGNVTQ